MTISLIILIVVFILLVLYFVLKPRNMDLLAAAVVGLMIAEALRVFGR